MSQKFIKLAMVFLTIYFIINFIQIYLNQCQRIVNGLDITKITITPTNHGCHISALKNYSVSPCIVNIENNIRHINGYNIYDYGLPFDYYYNDADDKHLYGQFTISIFNIVIFMMSYFSFIIAFLMNKKYIKSKQFCIIFIPVSITVIILGLEYIIFTASLVALFNINIEKTVCNVVHNESACLITDLRTNNEWYLNPCLMSDNGTTDCFYNDASHLPLTENFFIQNIHFERYNTFHFVFILFLNTSLIMIIIFFTSKDFNIIDIDIKQPTTSEELHVVSLSEE